MIENVKKICLHVVNDVLHDVSYGVHDEHDLLVETEHAHDDDHVLENVNHFQ